MDWLLALGFGYLLGSIPFGLILTRAFGAGDLRTIGSGNIGATNVLRTGRKGLAAATLLLDAVKGFAAVWLAGLISADGDNTLLNMLLAGAGALIGHCFPVWLRFKGGKGVATMLGLSLTYDLRVGLVSALVWLTVTLLSRISSLGGMSSAIAAPVAALAFGMIAHSGQSLSGFLESTVLFSEAYFLLPMALLVIFQHRANIARLRAGAEPKIGQRG